MQPSEWIVICDHCKVSPIKVGPDYGQTLFLHHGIGYFSGKQFPAQVHNGVLFPLVIHLTEPSSQSIVGGNIDCIDCVLDTQQGSRGYSCPECRAECAERPSLQRNITLCNIVERFQITRPDQEEIGIFCTYCIHSPVPAAKSCLCCEASLCDSHLRVHSKSPEHVLCDPTNSFGSRKCSAHNKILEYYCTEDSVCICMSCRLDRKHKQHKVESLKKAFEKKKKKLRNVLQKLTTQRQETEKRVQRLQEHRREVQEKAAGVKKTVTVLFREIKRQMEDLEKRVLGEISRQEERISLLDLIQQLEIKKVELSRRMRDIEELCNTCDPVTVLQEPADCCDAEDGETHEEQVHGGGYLDMGLISGTLQTLSDIIIGINTGIYVQRPADILLDVNTANDYIHISDEWKTASWSHIIQNRPVTPERFQDCPQVMSSRGFSSGRHYWEVEIRRSESWRVGMCYPSIDRTGDQSVIGGNNKSWGLRRRNNNILVIHDRKHTQLPGNTPCDRVRVCLDYGAGLLSFYSLSDPIRHLRTFSSTFTEPLHAVLGVWEGSITISGL